MRRSSLAAALVVALASLALAAPASAETSGGPGPLVFPVVGEVRYQDTFGAPRSGGRSHEGQDIMADKMQPLVAVTGGTITYITIPEPSWGYMLTITDDAGWSYHYIHINNDTPGTDDGAAALKDVFGPGIEEGARVVAGQLVGYVGDSGNAEHVAPQLHFEIESPEGAPVNPMASLDAARRADAPAAADVDAAPVLDRIAGEDRVATAVAVSRLGWPDGAGTAVIANGDSWAEALAAAPLAAAHGAPLLLTRSAVSEPVLLEELERLAANEVIVIADVASDRLAAEGYAVRSLGVPGDVVATAAAIADDIGAADGALLVSVASFADAISASTLAVDPVRPVLFSRRDTVPQVTVDAWRRLGQPSITIVGGTAAVGDNIADFFDAGRVAGEDRYATSAAVANEVMADPSSVLIASGTAFADALAVAPLAGRRGDVALLVDGLGSGGDAASLAWLGEHADVSNISLVGGTAAVSRRSELAVAAAAGRL